MTDRHAFLAAIKANPDDDTPRLVFADWLDEHGEPERAAMLRVQVEGGLQTRQRIILQDPAGNMLNRHDPIAVTYDRGIIVRATLLWDHWLRWGDRLYEIERPWQVQLTSRPGLRQESSPDGIAEYRLSRRPHRRVGADELPPGCVVAEHLCCLEWPGTNFVINPGGWPDYPFITLPAGRSPSPRRP